jgi:hypothetical protein
MLQYIPRQHIVEGSLTKITLSNQPVNQSVRRIFHPSSICLLNKSKTTLKASFYLGPNNHLNKGCAEQHVDAVPVQSQLHIWRSNVRQYWIFYLFYKSFTPWLCLWLVQYLRYFTRDCKSEGMKMSDIRGEGKSDWMKKTNMWGWRRKSLVWNRC